MRLKLDENLPSVLATPLRELGHDVHTVEQENLAGHSDDEVWAAAQREERFLITQDLDFSDIRNFAPGKHHGILLLRLHNPDFITLIARVHDLFREENVKGWGRSIVVASEHKVRILRPPN